MQNFSQNIPLFTATALTHTKKLFLEYGIYVFSDNSASKFKSEIYNQATHIGIWEKFDCQWDEWTFGKFVKIEFIGKILETGSFKIDFQWDKITNIIENSSKIINNTKMLAFMQSFMERSVYCKDNWEFSASTEKRWRFICVNPDKVITINENILYPSKSLVSFSLNIDKNKEYIPAKEIINTIQISENAFLDLNNKELLVKNFSDDLKKWEILLENNLKKVSLWDDNKGLYMNILEILHKNPDGFEMRNFEEFDEYTDLVLKEKIKGFNKGNSVKYLDFSLWISEKNYGTKSFRLYKNFNQKEK